MCLLREKIQYYLVINNKYSKMVCLLKIQQNVCLLKVQKNVCLLKIIQYYFGSYTF